MTKTKTKEEGRKGGGGEVFDWRLFLSTNASDTSDEFNEYIDVSKKLN